MPNKRPNLVTDNKKQKQSPDKILCRELNTPIFDKAEFVCPEFFNNNERAEWEELIKLIGGIKRGIINDADKKCMIIRVQAWVEYLRFDADLKRTPDIYLSLPKQDKFGNTVYQHVRNINYDLRKKSADTVLKCDSELGITPVGRARIGLARANSEYDEADSMLTNLISRKGDND